LRKEFKPRFQDFGKHETYFRLFSSPFEVDFVVVAEEFQMELVDFQSREEIKYKFLNVSQIKFYKLCLPKNNSPHLYRHTIHVSALFGRTYVCEQLFSKMMHPNQIEQQSEGQTFTN
jgi:hypothetical protein